MDKILKDEYTARTATYDMCMEGCVHFRDIEADVFDSGAVRRLCEGGIVGQDDILVTMFVDQFNLFDHTKMLAAIIHVQQHNAAGDYIWTKTLKLAFPKMFPNITQYVFFGDELPVHMRTLESLCQLEGNSYSVNGPNAFRDLPTLTSPAFFGLNKMHLLRHDIGKQLYKALGEKFQISPEIADNADQLNQIDRSITKYRADIPAIFTGSWWLLKKTTGQQKAVNWLDFLLFVVPTVVVKNFVLAKTRNAVQDLVKACTIAQQWKVTEREVNIMEEAIGCWHVFLRHEVAEKRLEPTIFVINQHMLTHLSYMMREMGPLQAYSCHLIKRTIGEYRAAIQSWKEPGKNMENILLCKARVKHCLGSQASRRRLMDRRTSNFEVASNNIAGPQLWSNPTRKSLGVVADECEMNYHNLISSLACLWLKKPPTPEYLTIVDCLRGIWPNNEEKFPVWESLTLSEIKVVEMKSITGMAGLIHDINNETIRHVVFPHPHYYK
ncbi:hypothetical protein PHYBLDRAFT_144816 [Phycomyces blakesleeanus NRRL 1555(-)]|uniref:Uncharacterized protein n=1 Tax=Phycomyces blakesleeanus (strain ATCC 8743b / DSM 1359 / FGSC 10004 / NBRC 33097 / NRRL 1555) TaxID=763407 RepID=A0A162PMV7_PHYB8|nr:hypothetical protein PHYBLDRAFT_144816 [Phycomyces blakesleeanus NRRL 1555(-)]OAD74367.1 hypothetical protein PHYBLDRAFT_144816 [Phycomyces blakesleeanus NRRL 1555(-)]|eukprot:XP_018292407.1 hypothetical protein PHYBLDRAFT_144816 [Phycomyces blakesleeanus NRRL 1555(-)]